jgi:hypothetical protein
MEIKDQKDPIENDQFGNAENTTDATENTADQPLGQPSGEENEAPEIVSEINVTETTNETAKIETKKKKVTVEPTSAEETPTDQISEPVKLDASVPEKEETPGEIKKKKEKKEKKTSVKSKVPTIESEGIAAVDEKDVESGEEEIEPILQEIILEDEIVPDDDSDDEDISEDDSEDEIDIESQSVDYSSLSREELVDCLVQLLANKPIQKIRAEVESIKVNFYKKHKAEFEKKRKEWVESGGNIEEFEAPEDTMEPQIKELLKQFRDFKSQYNRDLEVQKVKNLEEKQAIIEQIKELVNRNESVNQTFQEFRELQQKWREIGPVPQANLNDLWETYHHHVQGFYDFVKINKDLRDLDLKRNQEEKIILCEKAEELLLEPSVITAFKKLQKLHNQWREIGPVPNENRTEIWERFREVTSTINKRHQEHFESLRDEQKVNLEAKSALCEKAEDLAAMVIKSTKDWNKYSKEMIELQKIWKTIGFAPKRDNNKIYERFRSACDNFFNNKREFYQDAREDQMNNLQFKTELCMQAEALKVSTEWKKTSDELINLQKRWKEIGPVPRKHSEELWKRFRAACDHFFERKSQHFSQVDNKYLENLRAKEDLIAEIEKYVVSENIEDSLKVLKDFQRRWAEIGFVPIKKKDELQKSYREAINKHFENLKIDNSRKNILKFKTKIDTIQGNPRQENKIRVERERLFNQMKQLENDIVLWENNIGFFTKSKNAEQLIKDVEKKIEKGRVDLKVIEEKIRMIDSMDHA